MIIEFSDIKYQPGHARNCATFKKQNILRYINFILEKDFIKFPENHPEELIPGDVFLFQNQVIAVESEDELLLVFSETGGNALQRIYTEYIESELTIMSPSPFEAEVPGLEDEEFGPKISWEAVNSVPKECKETWTAPFGVYRLFKNKLIPGRGFIKNWTLKVKYQNLRHFIRESELYFIPKGIMYNPETIDPSVIGDIALHAIKQIYSETERIVERSENIDEPEEEKEEA